MVFIPGALPVGELVDLEIASAGPYDLWANSPGGAARPLHRPIVRRKRLTSRARGPRHLERRGNGRPVPMAQ